MFKKSIQTYGKNLKQIVTVLGILFLTILIGLTIVVKGTGSSIDSARQKIEQTTEESDYSFKRIGEAIQRKDASAITSALGKTIGDYIALGKILAENIGVTVAKLIGLILIFLILQLLGLIITHDIVFIRARYNKGENTVFEVWFELYVKNFLLLIYLGLAIYLFSLEQIKMAGIILLILYPIIYCYLSLLAEWIAAGKGRPKYGSVVTIKNTFLLFLENLMILLFCALLISIILLILDGVLAVYLALAILIISLACLSMNACAFFEKAEPWESYLPEPVIPEESTTDTPSQSTSGQASIQ